MTQIRYKLVYWMARWSLIGCRVNSSMLWSENESAIMLRTVDDVLEGK